MRKPAKEDKLFVMPEEKRVAKSAARKIANDLFISGLGKNATRLLLLDADGEDLGGLIPYAVATRVERLILEEFSKRNWKAARGK